MSWRRRLLFLCSVGISLVVLAVALCPDPGLYNNVSFSSAIQDRDGRLMRLALANDDRYRLRTSLHDIAASAIDATLLYEDQYFWSHPGVNPGALLRASWSTFVQGNRPMGASTITMQLARSRFALNTRTISGKIIQMARAIQLERHYTKQQILEAYLNLAPYGGNIEGIGTAALIYFDRSAAELTLAEALSLSVIAQNPTKRDPSSSDGYKNMRAARTRLLAMWLEKYDLSDDARAQIELPIHIRPTRRLPFTAPHFSREVLARDDVASGRTRTTIDRELQSMVEDRLERYTQRKERSGIRNASAMLLDHRTMEVLASVGSAGFFDVDLQGQVSGTAAKRSPGSTLKPFVYGLAIDQGLIHPASLLHDAPRRFAAYTPENFDRGFVGPVKAMDALIYSRNVPAIELLAKVGHKRFHRFLVAANVKDLRPADHYGLAMILGGNELTMKELVVLYAMLANHGRLRRIEAILSPTTVAETGPSLLSPEASFLVLDMLRRNPRPNTLDIRHANRTLPIAWKTGTSYAHRDAWTVGVFGQYVLAVWVGNFDGSANPAFVGQTAAAPLFFEIVDSLQETIAHDMAGTQPGPDWNLTRVDVCADTGDLPGRYCPTIEQSWFIPGKSPISVSNIHRGIRIETASGRRACHYDSDTTHVAVFEFWPSDILAVFRAAGIAIRQPPKWSADCTDGVPLVAGIAPRITSPSSGLTYYVRPNQFDHDSIPLTAATDGDVEWLYWFANNRFIARSTRDNALFWRPGFGDYTLTVVDEFGRSHSRRLSVRVAP